MKKLIILLFSILMLVGFSMVVSADTIPVKDAWFISGDGAVLVLCENGNLYTGQAVNDDTPTLLLSDVVDVVINEPSNGKTYGAALHTNGKISLFETYHTDSAVSPANSRGAEKATIYRELDVIASELISTSYKQCFYINGENQLVYFDTGTNSSGSTSIIADNVEKTISGLWGDVYIVNTQGVLNKLELDRSMSNRSYTVESESYVMSGVNDIINFEYSGKGAGKEYIYLVLKSNGDLYMIDSERSDPPERIGKNVQTLDNANVKVYRYGYNQDHYCEVDYVDSNGGFYVYNSIQKQITQYYDDAKAIYHFKDSRAKLERYVVSTDNKVYYCGYVEGIPASNRQELSKNVGGFFTGTKDKIVYSGNGKDIRLLGKDETYLSGVKTIINNTNLYNNRNYYMFIKTNGELWASQSMYNEPFLTKFSDKPTKLYINGYNVTLVSEIQIVNNRSMYPFRECLENMGATVLWDSVSRCAIGEYNGITVEFPIDKNYYYINGEIHYMDTTSYISNGRTYIPIRFAAEALGFTVEWESTSVENKISIFE